MKGIKKGLAILLVLCTLLSMVVMTGAAAPQSADALEAQAAAVDSDFYKIVHVDCGRKYFSPENIKKIIDNAAAAGFNQVELYLSDNQGFRFALDDMTVTTSTGNTYDLTPALGDGYSDGSKYPDGSGKYLTQSEMTEIISYASTKGIDIVPCINVPGHMGAILEEFTGFRYSSSKSSIDLENEEAVAFALAITEKYAAYFASQGVKYYNLGADEYANDMSTMGFQGLYTSGKYPKFVAFLNNAAQIVLNHGMTPRAFNDGICYNNNTSYNINKNIEVCYWTSGWNGYNVASAATLNSAGYKLINTHGDYYWVLGNSGWQCSADKASEFNYETFQGGTISNPAGAMFCIWCDNGAADGQDDGASVASKTADVIRAFGAALPATETPANTVTCSTGDVAVTAPGLTSVTCTKVASPAYSAEGATVVGYDITPYAGDAAYNGSAKVTIAVPDELKSFPSIGVYDAKNGKFLTGVTVANGVVTFTAPHFSEYDLVGQNVEVTEDETINVIVGQTATDTISGANYAGDYTTDNPSIATVDVTGEDGLPATPNYSKISSMNCTTLLNENAEHRLTAYYCKVGDQYYPLYVTRTGDLILGAGTRTYTYEYTMDGGQTFQTIQAQNATFAAGLSLSKVDIDLYERGADTPATPASTTVTFTGVSVGTTYVTVGNTRYTIVVSDEDLTKVTPLTVEYWITNRQVTAGGGTSGKIAATAEGVHSESGVLFSSLVPDIGTHDSNTMVFWKGTRLASGNTQTTSSGDKTTSGTDFTYIRYWEGSWAYSADSKTWTNVVSGDQIVAYYLQKTEVTDEVTTEVVDWGVVPSTSYNSTNFVLVDFAVKYESGERVPGSFPVSGKTMAFHCDPNDKNTVHQYNNGSSSTWSNNYRDIGMIKAEETAEYEVYMITVTPTNDSQTTQVAGNANTATSYTYGGTEKVVWVDDEANLGDFADESLHYTSISGDITYSVGGEPIVPGLEIFNRHGMLVTYYVRAKVTEDSLAVHYIDQTANQEFYNYNIAVKSGTLFSENIGLKNPWKDDLANGSVTNLQGRTQTVSADLSTMPAIGAQYRYSDYTCVKVERSEDGKDVYLYYTFNDAHSFVVDFGLPVNITAENLKLTGGWDSATATNGQYGTVTVNNGSIIYTPTQTLKSVDSFQLTLTDGTGSSTRRIYIYPATTVYYEEGFATPYNDDATGGSKGDDVKQTTSAVGSKDHYGYDDAYNTVGDSNGSVMKLTAGKGAATFTFTGTGVDIYTRSTMETGSLMIRVVDNDGKLVKVISVNTVMKNGSSDATSGQEVTAYNVPVVSLSGLTHGTYTLQIAAVKSGSAGAMDVYLDGFRVHGTLDVNSEVYHQDGEANPTFVELRNAVLAGLNVKAEEGQYAQQIAANAMSQVYATAETGEGAVVLEASLKEEVINGQDLLDNGPKNELYLRPKQTVVFKIAEGYDNVQVGLKALNASVSYTMNGTSNSAFATSTDMFYPVTLDNNRVVTITNNSGAILSITEVKAIPSANAASEASVFAALTENDLMPALLSMGFEAEPVEATATLSITVQCGNKAVPVTLTADGMSNETHTFTAAEIKAAVEQALPEGYTVADVTFADVTVTCGDTADVTFTAAQTQTPEVPTSPLQKIVALAKKIFQKITSWF